MAYIIEKSEDRFSQDWIQMRNIKSKYFSISYSAFLHLALFFVWQALPTLDVVAKHRLHVSCLPPSSLSASTTTITTK